MPEFPDIEVYVAALNRYIRGQYIRSILIKSPFVLRSVDEDIQQCTGMPVVQIFRIGKQIVWELPSELFLIFHLMISGRVHWVPGAAKLPRKADLLSISFDTGTITFDEKSSKKRASLHFVRGTSALAYFRRGGIEPLESGIAEFETALLAINSTLKRALTDPQRFSGIGNAYSDGVAQAHLSPFLRTRQLTDEQRKELFNACRATLQLWRDRLLCECGIGFPENVTPFRKEMIVHGRFGKPCGQCGCKVQRIVYSEREFNYCPKCQTDGRILADRSLSRLLKDDWPKRIEEEDE